MNYFRHFDFLLQPLNSSIVAWKQPKIIHKQVWLCFHTIVFVDTEVGFHVSWNATHCLKSYKMQINILSSRAIRIKTVGQLWPSAVVCPPLFYMTKLLTSDKLFTLEGWSIAYYLCPRAELGKELLWVLTQPWPLLLFVWIQGNYVTTSCLILHLFKRKTEDEGALYLASC